MQGLAGPIGNPLARDPIDHVSSRVQAVGCFVPPTDFLNYGQPGESALGTGILKDFAAPFDFRSLDPKARKFVPITEPERREEIGRAISPINHVTPDDPPILLICGDADKLVPIQQSESLLQKLKDTGIESKLVVKPGAGHVWPGMLNDFSLVADWFDAHLKVKASPKDETSDRK